MLHNLKPYPAYKDSGVPWLGEVPEHWEVERLKAAVAQINDQTSEKKPDEVYVALEHVESWTGRVRLPNNNITFDSQVKRFHRDDVLFGKLRPYLAKVTRLSVEGVCVGEFLVLRPRSSAILSPFLENILRSKPIIDVINSSTYGAKMPRADWGFIGNLLLCFPPNSEQSAIVRYLDHFDRRIRRYIRAKQKLIKLLEEQKQAIIHQAVTRGLDPNVKMKNSGVEWLGDVPEHWEVSRVKNEFKCLNHQRIPLSGTERGNMTLRQFDYYGASGVIDKVDNYLFDDELLLIAEDGANLVLRNLPLVIIARGKFWVNNHAHILKPVKGNLEYLSNLMETLNYKPWISGAAQPKLTQDRLMSIAIAVPPIEEQECIIESIRTETTPLLVTISQAHREISLLHEYRTRLIADVVTGKLDVREAAANLPEETDETEALDEELAEDEETTEEEIDCEIEEE
jgi:type I restriction enzyme S subunit